MKDMTDADAVRDAQAMLGRHPSPEQITAYADGTAGEALASAINGHAAGCAECAALIEMAADGLRAVEASAPTAARSRGIRTAVFAGAGALAAGWFAAVIWINPRSLDARLEEAERRVADLQSDRAALERDLALAAGPRINVRAVDVFPDSLRRRTAANDSALPVVLRGAADVILVLNSQASEAAGSYRATLLDSDGRIVWDSRDLAPQAQREFTIQFPGTFLAAGTFELRLYGPAGSQVLETYRFVVK